MINHNDIEKFLIKITNLINLNQESLAEKESKLFFKDLRKLINEDNFIKELEKIKLSSNQKDIILDIYKNGKNITEYCFLKMSFFSSLSKEEQILEFDKIFFNEEFAQKLKNKSNNKNDIESKYSKALLYLREEILPSVNIEAAARIYLYVISGKFYEDYNKNSNITLENLEYNIGTSLSKLQYNSSKQNPYDSELNLLDNNIGFKTTIKNYLSNNGKDEIPIYKRTPKGEIDAAILFKDTLYIMNVTNNKAISDLYDHLKEQENFDIAVKKLEKTMNIKVVVLDLYKGNTRSYISNIFENKVDLNTLNQFKKTMDIILNVAVSERTEITPLIVQAGDCKYNIENESFLNLYQDFLKIINNNTVNINNEIIQIFDKTSYWLLKSLRDNPKYYEEKNIEKILNIGNLYNEVYDKYNLEPSTDLRYSLKEVKYLLSNPENSLKEAINELNQKNLKIDLSILNTNYRNLIIDEKIYKDFLNIKIDLEEIITMIEGFSSDKNKLFVHEMGNISELIREGNKQYTYLSESIMRNFIENKPLSETLKNKISYKNDPLLKLLHNLREDVYEFYTNLENSDSLINNFTSFKEFLSKKGNIYEELSNKKKTDKSYKEKFNKAFEELNKFEFSERMSNFNQNIYSFMSDFKNLYGSKEELYNFKKENKKINKNKRKIF